MKNKYIKKKQEKKQCRRHNYATTRSPRPSHSDNTRRHRIAPLFPEALPPPSTHSLTIATRWESSGACNVPMLATEKSGLQLLFFFLHFSLPQTITTQDIIQFPVPPRNMRKHGWWRWRWWGGRRGEERMRECGGARRRMRREKAVYEYICISTCKSYEQNKNPQFKNKRGDRGSPQRAAEISRARVSRPRAPFPRAFSGASPRVPGAFAS